MQFIRARYAILAIALVVISQAWAAELSGIAYTEGLQPAKFSLLTVNTSPAQRVLLENGTYDIILPQGAYRLAVMYKEHGILYDDTINVTVRDNGTYTYDFILFPTYTNRTEILPSIPTLEDVPDTQQKQQSNPWSAITIIILLIGIVALIVIFASSRRRQNRKDATAKSATAALAAPMASDLASVINAVKAEGGRTTQKELRKHIPCSEAKLSMMLTELEAKGKIEKIKKGRGNLIILKR